MDLELALRMCEAALKQAAREGAVISVAVVDAGGHLVSFQRMEGAGFAGAVPGAGQGLRRGGPPQAHGRVGAHGRLGAGRTPVLA